MAAQFVRPAIRTMEVRELDGMSYKWHYVAAALIRCECNSLVGLEFAKGNKCSHCGREYDKNGK